MSVQYHQEIFSNERLRLKVNFFGLKNDIALAENLAMSIYAYTITGQPIFSETLNCEQIRVLYEHLGKISIIRNSSQNTSRKFVETTDEVIELFKMINDVSPDLLGVLLSKYNEREKIESLVTFLSENEIKAVSAIQKQKSWLKEIENLRMLLALEDEGELVEQIKRNSSLIEYKAGQPEKIFQNWIEKNISWIFGIDYIQKYHARVIGLHSEADLIMESIDGFLDLIELKRPSHNIFGPIDSSHKSYYPSTDLAKVIGQSLHYLQEMDNMKLMLEKEYSAKVIRPRIKIIIGRTNNFTEAQFNALRMLNSQLSHLEIISYDSLLKYGEKMIAMLSEEKT